MIVNTILVITIVNNVLLIITLIKVFKNEKLICKVNKIDNQIDTYNKKVDRLNRSLLDVKNIVNDEKYKQYRDCNKYDEVADFKNIKTVELGKDYKPSTITDVVGGLLYSTKNYFM